MVIMFRSARRIRRPSQIRDMAERSVWIIQNIEDVIGIGSILRSIASIILAFTLVPTLLISYIVVSLVRALWCKLLERRFNDIEPDRSPSVRAATDTRRNQGIVTLLLTVNGRCDPDFIRSHFQIEILDRRNEQGEYLFHRLRSSLTSIWGHYVWRTYNQFRLDAHIVTGSQFFRGRIVTEGNIQDYVSDMVSKYLPAELPPWQIILIPLTGEERFYMLIRLHHLLVDEVNAIHHILRGQWGWGTGGWPLVQSPRTISYICSVINENYINICRHLRLHYDNIHYDNINIRRIIMFLLYIVLDSHQDIISNLSIYQTIDPFIWIYYTKKQLKERNITTTQLFGKILYCVNPIRILNEMLQITIFIGIWALKLPIIILNLIRNKYSRILVKDVLSEVIYWLNIVFHGPRIVFGEFINSITSAPPPLMSLCGRRVVAWSDPTPVELVEHIAYVAGVEPIQVLLAAACGALREHYRRQGFDTPAVPVQPLGSSGVLLLPPLPTHIDDPVIFLRSITERINKTRKQPALLLASAWLRRYLARLLPSLAVRLVLNCVTRRYAATIMTSAPLIFRQDSVNICGYNIDNVLIWRPPQSNISVSLSLVRIGNNIRLAVMADQQLWPHHAALPTAFIANLRLIGNSLGVQRPPSINPNEPSTSTSNFYLRQEEEKLED